MQQKSFCEVVKTGLPALKTIEIGKSATGFDSAVWKLSGLIPYMVTVEDRVTATRKAVKLKAKDIEYTTSGNEITITAYNGTYPDIIIPKTIGGKKVVAIGAGAFSSTGTLRTVSFGANVREIGEGAFSYCLNLQQVQFNYGLRQIQKAAFKSTRIKKIIIPSTVTVINCEAFDNVTTVETLIFYGNAPLIGGDTFGVTWWGNPMPKLTVMSIGNNATGYDGDYWVKRGLTDIISRMSVKVGADSDNPKLLKTIDLSEK
jgi:hypothetical protein